MTISFGDINFILDTFQISFCVVLIEEDVWNSTHPFQKGTDGRFLKYTHVNLEIRTKFWFETCWREHLEELVMYERNTLLYERNNFGRCGLVLSGLGYRPIRTR
jgi:hypothetical protein